MLGGYQIIDFGGIPLSNTPVTIKDAYKKALSGKAILLENVVFDDLSDVRITTFGCAVAITGAIVLSFTFTTIFLDAPVIGEGVIAITDEDAVTGDIVTIAQET